ncbi:MAG: metallophosphoesterase family protein [bacterium]
MRYGIISDIHSNLPALEVVITYLKNEVDAFLCLGDIVGYGAQPNECCDIIRELRPICVAGNHDWGAVEKISLHHFNPYAEEALIWTRENLKGENRDFLASLPKIEENSLFTLVHGSLRDPIEEYLLSTPQARDSFSLLTNRILFFGHTHIPTLFLQKEGQISVSVRVLSGGERIKIKEGFRYLINPGSVGQPRDNIPLASFAIYDSERSEVEIRRLEYKIEEAQRRIISAGLPLILAERLSFGW